MISYGSETGVVRVVSSNLFGANKVLVRLYYELIQQTFDLVETV